MTKYIFATLLKIAKSNLCKTLNYAIIAIFVVAFASVSLLEAKQAKANKPKQNLATKSAQKLQNTQTFVVKCQRCIIHISFDNVEIARLKREFGEEGFYEVVDDMLYYNSELWDYARANGIEVEHIEPSEYGFVEFDEVRLNTSEHKRAHFMYAKGRFPQKIEYLATPHAEINAYFSLALPK